MSWRATRRGLLVHSPTRKWADNNEEATRESFTPDGYFRTGDIGQREAKDIVRIIDRKKNVFKLANGEFVAPERIEMALLQCDVIDQICVVGEPSWTCVLAVVVPNAAVLAQREVARDDSDAVQRTLLADLRATGRSAGLATYEVPWRVLVEWNEFTPENELMTYSNKVARKAIEKKYAKELAQMVSLARSVSGMNRNLTAARSHTPV